MTTTDVDISNAVQTELKLYMTQQLHQKGYLSDKMCADATELILKEAKNLMPVSCCHTEQLVV